MSRTITGPIEYPDGTPIALATLKLVTSANSFSADGSTPTYTEITTTTDAAGDFSLTTNFGQYRVLLQEAGQSTWLTLGTIVVGAGTAIELGDLIDTSDTSAVLTFADIATQTWVAGYVLGGGSPGDIAITDLSLGTATASQYLRVNAAGTAIIGEDPPNTLRYFYGQMG